jgi:hypothetical protein
VSRLRKEGKELARTLGFLRFDIVQSAELQMIEVRDAKISVLQTETRPTGH